MMKFADVKNDIAFRKIFGNQKKSIVLISFLNAVLELEGQYRISKITILNPYLVSRIAGEKSAIIDVRATDQRGRQFVVEMQVADKKGFAKRVQYYTSRDYSMQIDKGEDYPKLKPTYFVGILNFGIGFGKNYLGKHLNIEEETGKCVLSDIQHCFIQLTKFKKKHHELTTLVDKWTYFIKHAENLDVIPDDVDDEGLKLAYQEADKHLWQKEELIAYDNASMREQDERGMLELAKQEGKQEGEEKKEIEMILAMNETGISIAQIATIAKITEKKVHEIIEQHKKNRVVGQSS